MAVEIPQILKTHRELRGKREGKMRFGRKRPNMSVNKTIFDINTWKGSALCHSSLILELDLVQTVKPFPNHRHAGR